MHLLLKARSVFTAKQSSRKVMPSDKEVTQVLHMVVKSMDKPLLPRGKLHFSLQHTAGEVIPKDRNIKRDLIQRTELKETRQARAGHAGTLASERL